MRFLGIWAGFVAVLVVLIVNMLVFVLQFFMGVLVFVVFGQVQVDAGGHAQGRADKPGGDGFVEEHQREAGANEGGE